MIVVSMSAFLFLMISGLWTAFGRSLADTIAQTRVIGEANMAVDTLRRDLGGNLPEAVTGPTQRGKCMGWFVTGGGSRLILCFDGEPSNGTADWAPPDTTVVYEVQDSQLVRTNQETGSSFVVANHVEDFDVRDQLFGLRIELTIAFRDFTRTYTIVTRDP
jgi:hypothetical protein